MTLLDVIDLDEITTVTSMWQNSLALATWACLWFRSYEKIKIKKKMIEYDGF